MGPLVREKEARELDEIPVIARHKNSLVHGGVTQLVLVGPAVAVTLVGTDDIQAMDAADDRNLIGEVFVQEMFSAIAASTSSG